MIMLVVYLSNVAKRLFFLACLDKVKLVLKYFIKGVTKRHNSKTNRDNENGGPSQT